MRRAPRILPGAAAVLLTTGAALAQPAPTAPRAAAAAVPPAVDPALRARAYSLAQLLSSEESVVGIGEAQYTAMFDTLFKADPDLQALEAEYPGILDEMGKAMIPLVRDYTVRSLPTLWNRLADYFAASFSSAEIDDALGFYGSPTGAKMIRGMTDHADINPLLAEMIATNEGKVSAGTLHQAVRSATPAALADFTPDDRKALMAFSAKPAFRKIAIAGPHVQQLTADWINASDAGDAEFEATMTKLVLDTIARRTGEAQPIAEGPNSQ